MALAMAHKLEAPGSQGAHAAQGHTGATAANQAHRSVRRGGATQPDWAGAGRAISLDQKSDGARNRIKAVRWCGVPPVARSKSAKSIRTTSATPQASRRSKLRCPRGRHRNDVAAHDHRNLDERMLTRSIVGARGVRRVCGIRVCLCVRVTMGATAALLMHLGGLCVARVLHTHHGERHGRLAFALADHERHLKQDPSEGGCEGGELLHDGSISYSRTPGWARFR